ncbi:MAG TPA: DNA repair protein RecO [Cellvibrionales bacterium]|jgi:DNA repair protein RecO (recombination protein O)|nr:DNA repair protein RecO [Cellvibrionales bacterium]HCX26674.1 DNA repair protein RecO [Cellvibrionales bacterium]
MNHSLNHCFLLHQRPYRETSVIVDLLTESEGRVSVVCKGVRGSGNKAASLRSTLQPFAALSVAWSGKSSLKSLRSAEVTCLAPRFLQHQLYAALYLNELLIRLFQHGESQINLFAEYRHAITELSEVDLTESGSAEIPLRRFEFKLLATLGFEVDFSFDAVTGQPIESQGLYHFHSEFGFSQQSFMEAIPDGMAELKKEQQVSSQLKELIVGDHLLALQQQDYSRAEVRRSAKLIMRAALAPHLGGRALKSRELYSKK